MNNNIKASINTKATGGYSLRSELDYRLKGYVICKCLVGFFKGTLLWLNVYCLGLPQRSSITTLTQCSHIPVTLDKNTGEDVHWPWPSHKTHHKTKVYTQAGTPDCKGGHAYKQLQCKWSHPTCTTHTRVTQTPHRNYLNTGENVLQNASCTEHLRS